MNVTIGGIIIGTLLTAGGYGPSSAAAPGPARLTRTASHASAPDPTTHGYTLDQLRTAYNVTPLYALGYEGQGQTVAIVVPNIDAATIRQNLAQFSALYHLPRAQMRFVHVRGPVPVHKSWDLEATLDASMVHGFAPDAKIVFVEDTPAIAGFWYILNYHVSAVVSYSASAPESVWSHSEMAAINHVLQLLALRGTTILKGTGDWGATDTGGPHPPDTVLPYRYNVNFPASSPWVTALGGTQLTLRQDGAYLSERAWSLGGGGYSRIFKRPSWQVNPGIKPSEPMRGIPDAACDASPQTALRIAYNGYVGPIGGDSACGPTWAAFIALANQANGKPLGFINPKLYQIGRSRYYHLAFHDVTMGSNGYAATPNWDPATGLGSPNVYNLVRALTVGFSHHIPPAHTAGR